MKKILTATLFALYVSFLQAQTFSLVNIDTIQYNSPGYIVSCHATIVNNTSTGYYVDVIRAVSDTSPGWYTSFCVDVCYPPSTDSARFYLLPDSSQSFLLEFFTDAQPDSSSVLMLFKNVSNPSNSIAQRYHGVTQQGFGVNESLLDLADVKIFPSPAQPGSTFCFRINDRNISAGSYSLLVYDLLASQTLRMDGLINGDNYLSMNLAEGMYVYTLVKDSTAVKSGKIAIAR